MIYKVTKYQYNLAQKAIKAFTKKLDKYGLKWEFNPIGESVEEVKVYAVDPAMPSSKYEKSRYITNVVEFEFNCEQLKLGNYIPVASITHGQFIDEAGSAINKVDLINPNYSLNDEWYHIESRCEHCHTNRKRRVTFMLNEVGTDNYIQVGSTCVDEFIGIGALDILDSYLFFNEMMEKSETFTEAVLWDMEDSKDNIHYVHTNLYLAHCIERVANCGYIKYDRYGEDGTDKFEECTKYDAFQRCFNGTPIDQKFIDKADEMIKMYHRATELKPNLFYEELIGELDKKYTKMGALIAYAPVAYDRFVKELKEEELRKAVAEKSEHYGQVGDKVDLKLTLIAARGFDTQFGWTNVYTFVDEAGRQFVWFTGKDYEVSDVPMNVKGTIKEHSEYNGMKQTVLTRCKIN